MKKAASFSLHDAGNASKFPSCPSNSPVSSPGHAQRGAAAVDLNRLAEPSVAHARAHTHTHTIHHTHIPKRALPGLYSLHSSNDFHISSESYGGHYMPQLAEEILKRNEKAKADGSAPVINFSGFLVGNPYTDAQSNEVRAGGVFAV